MEIGKFGKSYSQLLELLQEAAQWKEESFSPNFGKKADRAELSKLQQVSAMEQCLDTSRERTPHLFPGFFMEASFPPGRYAVYGHDHQVRNKINLNEISIICPGPRSGGIGHGCFIIRGYRDRALRDWVFDETAKNKRKSSAAGAGADGNLRQNKAATATARLFRSRSAPGGKRALQPGVEPGSPKVSCTGRVRAKREGGKRTGLWKKLRTVLKNRLGAKRVVNKASSESAGSMGFESGRWSES
nr:Serine/threonine-protein kinase [Ipomoea batatas]